MREIKFRGYDVNKKLMCNITDINFSDNIANGVCFGEWCEFDTNKLMQYAGLKDKNGIEIYDGDILKSSEKIDSSNNYWIGVVEDNGFGWLALKYKEYINPSWLGALCEPINDPQTASWVMSTCEVIGNRYENSNLLDNN